MRIRMIVAVAALALVAAGCERAKETSVRVGEKVAHETGKLVGNAATAFFSGVGDGVGETVQRLGKGTTNAAEKVQQSNAKQ